MKKVSFILLVASIILSSCSYYTYYLQTGSSIQQETTPASIKIYSNDIQQDYLIIGSVAADVVGSGDNAVKYLKKKASKLGADAIIEVELVKINSYSQRTGISGVAVKLK